jgi:hypothetical protein
MSSWFDDTIRVRAVRAMASARWAAAARRSARLYPEIADSYERIATMHDGAAAGHMFRALELAHDMGARRAT